MNPFSERATPDPMFYRGLGFGFLAAGVVWAVLFVLVDYVF